MQFPVTGRWIGIFLAFQSQAWHTDDHTGHGTGRTARPFIAPPAEVSDDVLIAPPVAAPPVEAQIARIVAALVNPLDAQETETVTLLNLSPEPLDLTGWAILDRFEGRHELSGVIAPGATTVVTVSSPVQLGNDGGIITLVDATGGMVHRVSYTARQAARAGWTIVF